MGAVIPWHSSFWCGNDLLPLVSFAFTVLRAESELLALQMPEVLSLTPEFQDITFSLQRSVVPQPSFSWQSLKSSYDF